MQQGTTSESQTGSGGGRRAGGEVRDIREQLVVHIRPDRRGTPSRLGSIIHLKQGGQHVGRRGIPPELAVDLMKENTLGIMFHSVVLTRTHTTKHTVGRSVLKTTSGAPTVPEGTPHSAGNSRRTSFGDEPHTKNKAFGEFPRSRTW